MIEGIALRHFQAHEHTELKFHPGVNSIIGTSNSGKSSILRALFWVQYNRPSGQDFVSHWNRNKSGNPVEPTEVDVNLDERVITRKRAKDFNGYEIWTSDGPPEGPEVSLEAVGVDAPEMIQRMLNLSETNIQRQMDAPFLLSASNADVARFFNKVIRLDIIDRVLGTAESRRRKMKQEAVEVAGQVERVEAQLAELDWIEGAEKILAKADRVQERIAGFTAQIEELRETTVRFEALSITIAELGETVKARRILERVLEAAQTQTLLEKSTETLEALVRGYHNREDDLELDMRPSRILLQKIEATVAARKDTASEIAALKESLDSFRDMSGLTEALQRLKAASRIVASIEKIDVKDPAPDQLARLVEQYQDSARTIKLATKEIKIQTDLLPEICPTCGGAYHGETHEK